MPASSWTTIVRIGLILSGLSILGSGVTANEAFRHARRFGGVFEAKFGLALLSTLFALAFFVMCASSYRKEKGPAWFRLACFVGIGVEVAYQGFEILFYGGVIFPTRPHFEMVGYVQSGLFFLWMLFKIRYYINGAMYSDT